MARMTKTRASQKCLYRCLMFAVALVIVYMGLMTLNLARPALLLSTWVITNVPRDAVTHSQYARALEDSKNKTQRLDNNNNVDEKEVFRLIDNQVVAHNYTQRIGPGLEMRSSSEEPYLDPLTARTVNHSSFNNAAKISVLLETTGQTAAGVSSHDKLIGKTQPETSSSDILHSSLLSTSSDEEKIKVDSNEQFIFPELNASSLATIRASRIGQMNILSFHSDWHQVSNSSAAASAKDHSVEPSTLAELQMAFQPLISREERLLTLYVFHNFIRACQVHNLTFFLYGGSLIGAYRHHDLVPWDDDLDVMMDARQRPKIREVLASFRPEEFSLYAPDRRMWKFFWTRSSALRPRFPYSWPFIDIFFFADSGDHIYDDYLHYKDDYRFIRVQVFPLQLRPFAGAFLPVPCNMEAVLKVNYSPWLCVNGRYWHKVETGALPHLKARVACNKLFPLYPFVFRQPSENGLMIETLIKRDVQLGKLVAPKFCGEGSDR